MAAASLLGSGRIGCVVVGADRIARNGDTANKVGTYPLALAAHASGVPFYVAAPISTVDLRAATGSDDPHRGARRRRRSRTWAARGVAAEGVQVFNPAFDVTPARLVAAIVTERGVARPPYEASLQALAIGRAVRLTSATASARSPVPFRARRRDLPACRAASKRKGRRISMYAVVRTGGKQYRVKEGDLLKVEKLTQDVGAKVTLEVLLVGEGAEVKLGDPLVSGAKVEAEVVSPRQAPQALALPHAGRGLGSHPRPPAAVHRAQITGISA